MGCECECVRAYRVKLFPNMAASPVSCIGWCGLLVEPGPGAKESEEGVCVCVRLEGGRGGESQSGPETK